MTTTITLQQPDQAAITRSADAALALVESFEISDSATYELAADELTAIKRKACALDDQRKALTKPLDEAKKGIMDLFRAPLDLLTRAEGILKAKMIDFQQVEQRKLADARAAAERAAQAERDRLAAEAAQLTAQGRDGEALIKSQVAQMIVAAAPAMAEPPKVAGVSMRSTLDFEVVDLLALVRHIAQHPELIALVQADSAKLRAYTKGLGGACNLPGVRVYEKASLAASKK